MQVQTRTAAKAVMEHLGSSQPAVLLERCLMKIASAMTKERCPKLDLTAVQVERHLRIGAEKCPMEDATSAMVKEECINA